MTDTVFLRFLERQLTEGRRLSAESDIVTLMPLAEGGSALANRFILQLDCRGVLRRDDGQPAVSAAQFGVGIQFAPDYLRHAFPPQVLTWLGPDTIVHPNIAPPFLCIGHIDPGTGIVDLVFRVYELISYQLWAAHDALNIEAGTWALHHQDLLPVDRRPLKRLPAHGPLTKGEAT